MTLAVALVALSATAVRAQNEITDEGGFQPNRNYLALQPFEFIDTGSDNVVLTFPDLTLPGNAGRQLRFERVFANQDDVNYGVGPRWRFGIAGVPMIVVERPCPTSAIQPPHDLAAERLTTPYFWMVDGSRLETTYVQDPAPSFNGCAQTSVRYVRTANFWWYDRVDQVLRIPDGTTAQYFKYNNDPNDMRLLSISDPFGNTVSLTWGQGALTVQQSLGNGQPPRVVDSPR